MIWVEVVPGRWRLVDDKKKSSEPAPCSPFVRNERLSPKARRALKIQTGRDFDSESAARAYMRENNLRIVEGGEGRSRKRWVKGTKPGDRGHYEGRTNHLGYGVAEN